MSELEEDVLDVFNAIEAAIVNFKQRRAKVHNLNKKTKHETKEFDKLAWTEKQGSKGAYQQTTKEANNNSQLFQDLQKIVKEHKGFCQVGNFKLWFDRSNEDVIDRRAK